MRIGLIQLNTIWETKRKNFTRAENFVKKAALKKCDVVVLPEMFNSGFTMNISLIAERKNGETSKFLAEQSKKHDINIIAGYAIKNLESKKGFNQGVIYNRKGKCIKTFTKIHSFSYAKENEYFVSGDKVVTFELEGMPSSIFICFDLRFPEVFRRVAKKVHAIFVLANWPSTRMEHWATLLKARAIENQCFVIGVNRIGKDGNGINYCGGSKIYGPLGHEICSGSETDEFIFGEINSQEVLEARQAFPFLSSMRNL